MDYNNNNNTFKKYFSAVSMKTYQIFFLIDFKYCI